MKKVDYEKYPTKCNLCGGEVIYNRANTFKSRSGFVYWCKSCHAWVGTYPHSPKEAMGLLADYETRVARRDVHRWFDKLWKNHEERVYWYKRLADALQMEECHFSQMNKEELSRATEIIKKWWLEKYDI